jgi:ABC-2 type transport system ATP-binding protein
MALFPGLTLEDHVAYFAPGYPRWDPAYAERLVRRLDVPWRVPARALSSGDMQKAGLVLALAHRPELLILDEPAANLDVVVRRAVIELLVDHVADGSSTIFIASHILTDLERLVDRVGFLHGGKIALERPLDALKETVVKVRLTFPERVPPGIRVPHELAREESGRDLILTVSDVDADFLATLDGETEREVIPLGLEDIFIAVTSGRGTTGGAS